MKKVIIALMAFGSIVCFSVKAQVGSVSSDSSKSNKGSYDNESTTSQNQTVISSRQQPDLIKIRSSELPAMVTQTLGNADYRGWSVVNAYRTVGNDQYKVEVKKGTATQTYWFDKNGNKVDSMNKINSDGSTPSETTKQPGTDNSMPSGSTPTEPIQK